MIRRQINRLTPALPMQAYQTYALATPLRTHFQPATCAQVGCAHWRDGWRMVIDPNTELGRKQLSYIRLKSGRAYADVSALDSPLVTLLFNPGQRCFAQHRVPIPEREPLLRVRAGDWRGNPGGPTRVHVRSADWVEDFAEHQLKIIEERKRG